MLYACVSINIQVQLYIEESTSGVQWLISVETEVSDGRWHDVQIRKAGQNVTVTVDNNPMFEELGTLPSPLRTTSHLYIGGLPSEYMYTYCTCL